MGTTIRQLETEMEEQIHDDARDMFDSTDPEDRIHEYADSTVPVYNADRLECLTDDHTLAYLDDTGLVADDADIYTRIGVAIYERLLQHGYKHWSEVKDEIEEAMSDIEDLDDSDLASDETITAVDLERDYSEIINVGDAELFRMNLNSDAQPPDWEEENEDEIEEMHERLVEAYRKVRTAEFWEEF